MHKLTRIWLAVGLCLVVVYLVRGFYFLAFSPDQGAGDLKFRKVELHYFLHGQNPYEVFLANAEPFAHMNWDFSGRSTAVDPKVGVGNTMSLPAYPPWAYPLITLVAWPEWPATRYYFALVNFLALMGIAWGIYQIGGKSSRGALLATACLMTSTFCMTLGMGQLGILTLLFMVLTLLAQIRGNEITAGLFLGLSLLKPTLSLPFLIPFLAKRKFKPLVVCAATVVVLWAVTALVTKTPPLDLIQEWLTAAKALKFEGDGPAHWVASRGIPRTAFMAMVILFTVPLIYVLQEEGWIFLFGVTSVAARFWTYHRFYDNILLIFLLLAYVEAGYGKLGPRRFWAGFGVLALSLWPPASAFNYLTNEFQYLTWTACAAWLVGEALFLKQWKWRRV